MNHRKHRARQRAKSKELGERVHFVRFALSSLPLPLLFLFVLCGEFTLTDAARKEQRQPIPPEKRLHYDITLSLDFDERTYAGSEQVRWVNRGEPAVSTIFFHLYPNMRPPDYVAPTQKNDAGQTIADE